MNTVTAIAIGMLTLAGAINFARAIRPGTIIDRAIALDGVVAAIICGLGVAAVRRGQAVHRHREGFIGHLGHGGGRVGAGVE